MAVRRTGYFILSAITALGLWAIADLLFGQGHMTSNMTQHVPWGLGVVMYIFFLGLSAGTFLFSALVYVFGVKKLEPIGPTALLCSLICLMFGGLLIMLDLGHPERGYKILTSFNPTSVMAWMAFFYNFYIAVIIAAFHFALCAPIVKLATTKPKHLGWLYGLLSFGKKTTASCNITRDRKWLFILCAIGIPLSLIVHGGVGAIFAVAKARPGWFSGLFPIVFLVSAFASGGALLTLLTAIFSKQPEPEKVSLLRTLAYITVGILCFDVLLMVSEILIALYGNVPHDVIGWKLMLFGPSAWIFWVVQIGLGLIAPLILVVHPATGKSVKYLGLAGLLIVLGVFAVRYNIVVPALLAPTFKDLDKTYFHPRFALGYAPSLHEWLVCLGALALAVWGVIFAEKFLPLNSSPIAEGAQDDRK